jgi:hypothetical protein
MERGAEGHRFARRERGCTNPEWDDSAPRTESSATENVEATGRVARRNGTNGGTDDTDERGLQSQCGFRGSNDGVPGGLTELSIAFPLASADAERVESSSEGRDEALMTEQGSLRSILRMLRG